MIRSIHWFSVALTQNETANAFLFLTVALEAIFTSTKGNSIGGTIAESVALLISDNLKGRKELVTLIRKYYGNRSAVAHGGNKSISEIELYTFMNIVGTTIMVLIEKLNEIHSQEMLMSWIEDLKLS